MFALTCSSLILIYSDSETSLYHVFIARCLAQTNLAGLGSAFLFDTRRQGNWLLRIGILGIVLLLYLYWTYVTIWEFDHWTNSTPKCFFNESIVGGWFTYWMIVCVQSYSLNFEHMTKLLQKHYFVSVKTTLKLIL